MDNSSNIDSYIKKILVMFMKVPFFLRAQMTSIHQKKLCPQQPLAISHCDAVGAVTTLCNQNRWLALMASKLCVCACVRVCPFDSNTFIAHPSTQYCPILFYINTPQCMSSTWSSPCLRPHCKWVFHGILQLYKIAIALISKVYSSSHVLEQ